jgi:UDPglucose 6-dehydrogenase
MMKICCIGAGYVGGPTMAVIADKCRDIMVFVVDIDKTKINRWNSKNFSSLPVYEPGLKEIVAKRRNKNLFFSNNVTEAIKISDIIFIAVGTPTKKYGVFGFEESSDLSYVEQCIQQILSTTQKYPDCVKNKKIIVEKSTVPVKTANFIYKILNFDNQFHKKFEILSNPEFLSEGNAIKDLLNPDRVLIGGGKGLSSKNSINKLVHIYSNWVSRKKILTVNLWSSELSKLASNCFLAQRISSINTMSEICESTGANIKEVSKALRMDSRIGREYLDSSIGFGGSCFKKDLLNLIYLSKYFNLKKVASYWNQVLTINEHQKKRFVYKIVDKMNGVKNKKLLILGFSFKKNTNDVRESPAIDICSYLLSENARIFIYDPKANLMDINSSIKNFFDNNLKFQFLRKNLKIISNIEREFEDFNAIIILTEWDAFKVLDYSSFYRKMIKPNFLFDGRNILNAKKIKKIGFKYFGIGKK